jgi:dolichol-phosphate mannosyltransferase
MILVAVVPTYNEVGTLERLANALLRLELPHAETRLLIVDDASTDGTARLADELASRAPGRVEVLHRENKRGLGSAYIEGFARALANGADLVAQMDADLSHEPPVLVAMVEAIGDADLVIGSRYVRGGGVDAHWGWHRKLLSWSANRLVVPALLRLPVSDATSGYRLWRRDTLARIAPSVHVRSSSYGFQVEMAFLAHRLACRIKEVPIYFREREMGRSKMSLAVALVAVGEILSIGRRRRRLPDRRPNGDDATPT